jgi:hypothetical protein
LERPIAWLEGASLRVGYGRRSAQGELLLREVGQHHHDQQHHGSATTNIGGVVLAFELADDADVHRVARQWSHLGALMTPDVVAACAETVKGAMVGDSQQQLQQQQQQQQQQRRGGKAGSRSQREGGGGDDDRDSRGKGLQGTRPDPTHPKFRTKPCRHFLNGTCFFGKRCTFLHTKPNKTKPDGDQVQ